MRKELRVFSVCLTILFLIISSFSYPLVTKADGQPSVDFSVVPAANDYTLNADGEAKGNLNIAITPKGNVNQVEREPIDVAFVHDTSGSMNDNFDGIRKAVSAQSAINKAINYFQSNNKSGDNFYFIPFSDGVRTKGDVRAVESLKTIEQRARHLDKYNNNMGGTNYTQALEYAKNLLTQSSNKNKYIIFLTDGEPTVLSYNKRKYVLYTNGKALYEGETSSKNYQKTKDFIHSKALQTSEQLSQSNITMYSIGFAREDEIDFQLLENMSRKTGGDAVHATPANLTSIFEDISKKIDNYTISGEVNVDLKKFNGNVAVDPMSNAVVDVNQVAHIPFKFNFPVGKQPDPNSLITSLPLIFKNAGTYTFDNIKLEYDGTSPKVHQPFTITIKKDMNSIPGAAFSVQPSAEEFVKPPNENARGNINITVIPKGMAPKDERLPIDVVFVHDTSGSMAFTLNGVRKDTTAKNALKSAIKYFENNAKQEDRFFFVPFDSNVSDKTKWVGGWGGGWLNLQPTTGLSSIKNVIEYLDYFSEGGTNYTQTLSEAMKKFDSTLRNKYVIFLTDGEPSVLYKTSKDYYMLHSDGKSGYNAGVYFDGSRKYNETKKVIESEALNSAALLGARNITMYSIAFANEGEVNFQLLQDMSSKTAGYAVKGNPDNLTSVFDAISKKVNSTTISGNVTIDLKKFNGEVIVDPTSNFIADSNQVVQIPFKITFPVGEKPDPSLIQQSLPLQFKKAGTYEFKDNIMMTYTDANGNSRSFPNNPFTVVVKDETAPYFLNEVDSLGNAKYSPDGLVKFGDKDSETNEFTVQYKLIPDTVFTSVTKGTISNLKIVQPIPEGISLANTEQIKLYKNGEPAEIAGAEVRIINNGKDIEISLGSNNIAYESGKFSIDDYTVQLKLKADWAIPLTTMPQAALSFVDSRFGDQVQTLNIDEQLISMNVHLLKMGAQFSEYIGDYLGSITKVTEDGEVIAETQLSNDQGKIQKPVKAMKLINEGHAIEVTYYDDTTAVLMLKTDFKLKNLSLSEDLQPGATTKGRVGFKITDKISGEGVVYEYQLISNDSQTEWAAFDPTDYIELPKNLKGEITIQVRTKGGFSLNDNPVAKTITIIKESVVVDPNPIELNVGDSVKLNIKVTPEDGTNREFNVSLSDESIAKYENGQLVGLKEGHTKLIVTTTDIAGDEIKEEVPVRINPVLITRITVTPNPVQMKKLHEFSDFIINIEPTNASNQNLIWKSLNPSIVSILGPNHIQGKQTGTAEIEIRADDGSDVKTTITVKVGSPLEGINVPDEIIIEKGATDKNVNDYITYRPSDASNIEGTPTFNSTNENILEVESDGEIIPKRLGEADIEITVKDDSNNKFSAGMTVKIVEEKSRPNNDDKY
ncbi:VWA domain-containing protein [Niallia endozanthoxylica]|uniref:VWA domain-containing protein n=1 Tax=Niallia endozanthoxylica TaxID=2036016 RepID=A0A5J5HSS6_9BACI|nr:VWA domain-containing protein [Niallia endozanthoxylica]KAA9023145.1 VWA domain-containing protein [Niallia endozanthoxylica]